jgi:hypothetical protein
MKKRAAMKSLNPDIHFRIPKEEYKHLQDVAETMDRPVSYLIAEIVREWVKKSRGRSFDES